MPKIQIFCLHFAGGNCYSFDFLKKYLPEFDLQSIELPGRGKRLNEPFIKDFDAAATDSYKQILSRLSSKNYLIYGHSMGAYLGLKVAGMLERSNLAPSSLYVSGNPGPGVKSEKPVNKRYLMEDIQLKNELALLGGVPEEVLNNEELFNYVKPILQADFEVIEKNEIKINSLIKVPIHAIMGDEEDLSAEIANWARFTRGKFTSELMKGNHFFIYENANRIAFLFKEALSPKTS